MSIRDVHQKHERETRKMKHDNREYLTEAATSLLLPGSTSEFLFPCIACPPEPCLLLHFEFLDQALRLSQLTFMYHCRFLVDAVVYFTPNNLLANNGLADIRYRIFAYILPRRY